LLVVEQQKDYTAGHFMVAEEVLQIHSLHPAENYSNGGRYVSVWQLRNKEWRIVMLSVNVQDDVKAEKIK